MKNILLFEGAGCVPRGDLENCRIRTAFTNDEGKQIYLEIIGMETTKTSAPKFQQFTNYGWADHCFYITDDKCSSIGLQIQRNYSFEYCRAEILRFVNTKLHCSFDGIAISDGCAPGAYRVFGENNKYNFMEDYRK